MPVSTETIRTTREVGRIYNLTGSEYDEATEVFQQRVVYPRLTNLIEERRSLLGAHVLDEGCGSGRLMELLKQQGAMCQGVDISQTYVNRTVARGFKAKCASIHDLPFENARFDVVVSNYALNNLPHDGQRLVFAEAFRVLRNEGLLVFSCMHPSFIRDDAARTMTVPHFGEEIVLYLTERDELAEMVTQAGFTSCDFFHTSTPPNLEELIAETENPTAKGMLEMFRTMPYALFVIAIKDGDA